MSTDDALRAAAKRGELSYISLAPRAGRGGVVFHAFYRGASEGLSGEAQDADPAKAIEAAIKAAKKPKRRAEEMDFG